MDLLVNVLDAVRHSSKFLLLGYVLMPDHAHLLIATPTESLSYVLHQWKFKSGYVIQHHRQHAGRFWQPRYFDFICRHSRDVSNKLFYMHQNPIVARLATHPEDWKWSSASFYLRKGSSPITPDTMDFSGDPDELLWPAPRRSL
jgi:putative transposase